MRIKFLSVFAAVALLAACETAPDESANTGSAGNIQATTTAPAAAPTGPTPGSAEDFVVNVGDSVFFELDSSAIGASARTTLERQAFFLRKYPSVAVTIEGHCDERGTREYNLALGERRASAVRDYLVSLGIDASRVTTISYGKERPVDPASTEDAWAKNRRGVTVIN